MKLIADGTRSRARSHRQDMAQRERCTLGFDLGKMDQWISSSLGESTGICSRMAGSWLTEESGRPGRSFRRPRATPDVRFDIAFVAAYCGYDGPIMADPFKSRVISIRDIMSWFSQLACEDIDEPVKSEV